jgi:uncharacterized protein (UPF0332 family)
LTSDRRAEIEANLARAVESLAAARVLEASEHHDFAASRAYYAAFYAATAALLAEGVRYKKHSGVIAGVHQQFIKTGRLPRSLGEDLRLLNELRLVGDYGEIQHVPAKEAKKAIAAARRLVEALRKTAAAFPTRQAEDP